ncbi:common plant regulatory factor 1 isoform X4 [Quercus suber]|uniref:common plant regulatory factor 1 isoform X4 n=1 Tax=Quercus suber TaxID=58331 RepID=UPI000CE28050|nr:common plant regulatory factor 1-like isoform X4 [Quercus suber]XP_023875518.1 common plant regulatory factor 1-like isoform X4 [Quercus suber]POE82208.1 common plant regulatory factor 1 [Quercus suber]
MGNNKEGKPTKSEKQSSPARLDQTNQTSQTDIHVYPDWAAMQAYYGPRVAIPPYYNSTMASGHAPHPYMWGTPQPMMPPYGAPYAAIYPHGGVYAHPPVTLAVTPMSIEMPTKSGNTDRGLMKKLKEFDGLAMSIGNGAAESLEGGAEHRLSQSVETEGSSDGSDGNTAKANQTRRKRSREETPTTGGKTETQASPVTSKEVSTATTKVLGATVTPASVAVNLVGNVVSPGMTTTLEFRNTPNTNTKTTTHSVPQSCTALPSEGWPQNERELKRERRKQSNRESARRSRLRKQAETEELAHKVESLTAENDAIKSEIEQLTDNSEKLRLENATLMEKLKKAQLGQREEIILNSIDGKRTLPVSTENLLSRVNNSGSIGKSIEEKSDMYDKNSNSGAKLHQLLDASPRADAVAAG